MSQSGFRAIKLTIFSPVWVEAQGNRVLRGRVPKALPCRTLVPTSLRMPLHDCCQCMPYDYKAKKKNCLVALHSFFQRGSVGRFFFFFLLFFFKNYMSGIERCQHIHRLLHVNTPPRTARSIGRFSLHNFPATSKSKQSNTSCSDCDILNVLRVERRHVDPLFTCTANPTFCSLGAAMIGMSTARNFIWPYSSCNFVIYNCVEKKVFSF